MPNCLKVVLPTTNNYADYNSNQNLMLCSHKVITAVSTDSTDESDLSCMFVKYKETPDWSCILSQNKENTLKSLSNQMERGLSRLLELPDTVKITLYKSVAKIILDLLETHLELVRHFMTTTSHIIDLIRTSEGQDILDRMELKNPEESKCELNCRARRTCGFKSFKERKLFFLQHSKMMDKETFQCLDSISRLEYILIINPMQAPHLQSQACICWICEILNSALRKLLQLPVALKRTSTFKQQADVKTTTYNYNADIQNQKLYNTVFYRGHMSLQQFKLKVQEIHSDAVTKSGFLAAVLLLNVESQKIKGNGIFSVGNLESRIDFVISPSSASKSQYLDILLQIIGSSFISGAPCSKFALPEDLPKILQNDQYKEALVRSKVPEVTSNIKRVGKLAYYLLGSENKISSIIPINNPLLGYLSGNSEEFSDLLVNGITVANTARNFFSIVKNARSSRNEIFEQLNEYNRSVIQCYQAHDVVESDLPFIPEDVRLGNNALMQIVKNRRYGSNYKQSYVQEMQMFSQNTFFMETLTERVWNECILELREPVTPPAKTELTSLTQDLTAIFSNVFSMQPSNFKITYNKFALHLLLLGEINGFTISEEALKSLKADQKAESVKELIGYGSNNPANAKQAAIIRTKQLICSALMISAYILPTVLTLAGVLGASYFFYLYRHGVAIPFLFIFMFVFPQKSRVTLERIL